MLTATAKKLSAITLSLSIALPSFCFGDASTYVPPSQAPKAATLTYVYQQGEAPLTLTLPEGAADDYARQTNGNAVDPKVNPESMAKVKGEDVKGAGVLQTAVIVWIFTVAEVFKEQAEEAKLRNEKLTKEKKKQMLQDSVESVLVSEEFWLGLLGTSVTHGIAQTVHVWFSDMASNIHLKNILGIGASSVLSFGFWELFGQLWRDAVLMLPPAMAAKAHGVVSRVLFDKRHVNFRKNVQWSQDIKETEDYKVLQQIVFNMALRLFEKPDLRQATIYNCFRLRILRGTFYSLVASMTAVTVAGTAAMGGNVPAGFTGALVYTAFGITGAAIATLLPKSWTDALTVATQKARTLANENRLEESNERLRLTAQQYTKQHAHNESGSMPESRFVTQVGYRQNMRENALTALSEMYYDLAIEVDNQQHRILIAKQIIDTRPDNSAIMMQYEKDLISFEQFKERICGTGCADYQLKTIPKAQAQIEEIKTSLEEIARRAIHVYNNEVLSMNNFMSNEKLALSPSMVAALNQNLVKSCVISTNLRAIYTQKTPSLVKEFRLNPEKIAAAIANPEMVAQSNNFLKSFNFYTFQEDAYLNTFMPDRTILTVLNPRLKAACVEDSQILLGRAQ